MPLFEKRGSPSNTWHGPFVHDTWAEKWGMLCPLLDELGPHLTQCRMGRRVPPYEVTSLSIQPFGHNRHGPKIGACVPIFWEGAGSPSNTVWPRPISMSSSQVSP